MCWNRKRTRQRVYSKNCILGTIKHVTEGFTAQLNENTIDILYGKHNKWNTQSPHSHREIGAIRLERTKNYNRSKLCPKKNESNQKRRKKKKLHTTEAKNVYSNRWSVGRIFFPVILCPFANSLSWNLCLVSLNLDTKKCSPPGGLIFITLFLFNARATLPVNIM